MGTSDAARPLVVKVGGGRDIDTAAVVADLVELRHAGRRAILVHGGAATLDEVAAALGHPPRFVTSEKGYVSRRTDRRTLEIFTMVYAGLLNKRWVKDLQGAGVDAVGLSGLDGRLFEGRRKARLRIREDGRVRVLHDEWTGTVDRVNDRLLQLLLDAGYLPVLTPPGASTGGEAVNVDGDRAAAAVAAALGAAELVLLSDVPGLLRRFPDPESLVAAVARSEIDAALDLAQGRMKKKLLGAREALDGGVGRVVLADGRRDRPIARALDGQGTEIR